MFWLNLIEESDNCGFAIVLLSPDDYGYPVNADDSNRKTRARQNVVLELGYFMGKLRPDRVMVIDGSKGVEAQTIKLFKVCVMRHIPIFTFVNKMDREARDPFELMSEIERFSNPYLPDQLADRLRKELQGRL